MISCDEVSCWWLINSGEQIFPVGVIITMHLCRVFQLSPPFEITSEILLVYDLIGKHTFQTGFYHTPST